MAANEDQAEKYKCDRCGYWFEFSELAYLGAKDESCSPFMRLDAYCHDCYEEGERWKSYSST